ncbi:MAG: 3-hydroxyacyl-CoA dehydrogenase family protein [Chloroflexi bacterium]|nr:3-hydroxyacyl-CoA dehydrogenase family protein [Chloroflexota bacterium]
MGSQIAELFSRIGKYSVVMWDVKDELVKEGLKSIETRLNRFFVEKGRMTQDELREIMGRIVGTASIPETVKKADYVIEAVVESLDVKRDVFKKLDENAPPGVVLASNTSALNITEMAKVTQRPDRVAGMHFFNPVGVMRLVEVVRGTFTSQETMDLVYALSKKLGKEPVVCKDYSFGFLANRAYRGMRYEAVQMVWERVATPEDIDKALKLGYNLPVGPLELADAIGGWAIAASAEEDAMRELGPEKGKLHPLIRIMVRAGYTGRGGKGIYAFWNDVMSKW